MKIETKKLIEIYLSYFSNRRDVIALQRLVNGAFSYCPWWVKLTPELIFDLIKDKQGFGFYALNTDNHGRWLAFDDDTDLPNGLPKLVEFLKLHNWNFLLEGSRTGRHGHAWLLFDAPLPGWALRVLGETMIRQSKCNQMEIFPKQPVIAKVGSLLRAPLSMHLKSGQRGLFSDCPDKSIKGQLEWLAAQPLNLSQAAMREAIRHRPMPKPIYLKPLKRKNTEDEAVIDKETGFINFVAYAYEQGFSKSWNESAPDLPDTKKFLTGVCPLCVESGHDPTCEHLWVNAKTGGAGCWNCGKERFREICRVIRNSHKAA